MRPRRSCCFKIKTPVLALLVITLHFSGLLAFITIRFYTDYQESQQSPTSLTIGNLASELLVTSENSEQNNVVNAVKKRKELYLDQDFTSPRLEKVEDDEMVEKSDEPVNITEINSELLVTNENSEQNNVSDALKKRKELYLDTIVQDFASPRLEKVEDDEMVEKDDEPVNITEIKPVNLEGDNEKLSIFPSGGYLEVLNNEPSLDRPFVFFHIPKCGGSTLRSVFLVASEAIGKKSLIPCSGSVPCPVTEQTIKQDQSLKNTAACTEVFAGHFTTNLIPTVAEIDKEENGQCDRNWNFRDKSSRPTFDCLIALREPISRFVSHYYHFIEKDDPRFSGKKLSDLPLDDLKTIINSSANNTMVDYLSSHLSQLQRNRAFTMDEKIQEAERALSSCVLIILEDWDMSARLGEKAIPWLQGRLRLQGRISGAQMKIEHETIHDFSSEKAVVLQNLLKWDISLYKKALEIHQLQLRQFAIDTNRLMQNHTNVNKSNVISSSYLPGIVKAVTYFARGNPLNFWDQRFELYIDADFQSFINDGFNTIILLVPWAGFQISVRPITYNTWMLQRIEYVLRKASTHGLRVIFRVSYPHNYDRTNDPPGPDRCHHIMSSDTSNGFQDGWLDYMKTLNSIFSKPEFERTYLYSFFSWEDFYCLMGYPQHSPREDRFHLSKYLGFDKYLMEHYSPTILEKMYEAPTKKLAIPEWKGNHPTFTPYINFMALKWWKLCEAARKVHPKLTMEMRIDTEGGKGYDLHTEEVDIPRQAYWASYMAKQPGSRLSAIDALKSLENTLVRYSDNGRSPVILGQFNFQDNTPDMMDVLAHIPHEECNTFLSLASYVLKKYTIGYGLWAYRDYRQSEIFNGSFLLGTQGWDTNVGDQGTILFEDSFLLLNANGSFARIEQGIKQIPEAQCDNKNNNMEVCFRYRMRGNLTELPDYDFRVLWDGKQVDEPIEFSSDWKDKCIRAPALESNIWYIIAFSVQGMASVNIDNVEASCHTHTMYMNTVNNTRTSICGNGISTLNQILVS